nr:uncharacterized protein CTRU02_06020 [Colletotrichum truncatum]KAF6793148.1 hypothetical protein CTRU02_06020 [Colletotrichum truncatum]
MTPFLSVLSLGSLVFGVTYGQIITRESQPGSIKIGTTNNPPTILISSNETFAVKRAAEDLAQDFGRILGTNSTIIYDALNGTASSPIIIAGTLAHSELLSGLITNQKIQNISAIEGKWEAYIHDVSTDPIDSVSQALVVAGSDRRGTVYGLYSLSEQIGVSPWYYWADIPTKPAEALFLNPQPKVQGSPSVKYRGIFINDEETCLTKWARTRFPLANNNAQRPFTGKFYAHVFELILRLKGNYIWPAMKRSLFYLDDNHGQLAHDYGIVVGTSHHEPMTRAYLEQERISGPWDWSQNKDTIVNFFKAGAERSKNWETLYTVGMRGEGDRESPTLTSEQLVEILAVQQDAIATARNVSASSVPQAWSLYKEVGKYYQAGMQVPDDVTLMWTDDNFGNLLRTPYPNETSRAGGSGIYYHVNYVGEPKIYEWINTIQLVKTWEQMHLAYEKQAREIWIVNVGDIKPLEIPTTHFMDMAYDMSKHSHPESVTQWIEEWASRTFTHSTFGPALADILTRYGRLVNRRKYETLNMYPFVYSTQYHDEAENALAEWDTLLRDTQRVHDSLYESRPAFYQMVLHPVKAGRTVYELYIKTEIGKLYKAQRRTSTNKLAAEARLAFTRDAEISAEYNAVSGGKWDGIMCQVHIGYTLWYEPGANIIPAISHVSDGDVPASGIMGVAGQGEVVPVDARHFTLLEMHRYAPTTDKRWLDVFTRANGTFNFEITSNVSWLSISNANGSLTSPGDHTDSRSVFKIDWSSAPKGRSSAEITVRRTDGNDTVTAYLPVFNPSVPEDKLKGRYIEANGVVSIEAAQYSHTAPKNGVSYVTLPAYGKTLSAIKPWPVTIPSLTTDTAPEVTYDFYTFSDVVNASVRVYLGGSRNHDGTRPLKYSFSVDGGAITNVLPVENSPMGSNPKGWADSVITGGWNITSPTEGGLDAGPHSLSLWLLEPGVVVQKVVIDLGGVKANGLGPPESFKA